ncbi:MAG TPA: hypothetical protein VGO64_10185 [Candidatus Limnocylindrales bacterium]|nr:hypothetical protein [Candidatus Limnocylindrales bacterium]
MRHGENDRSHLARIGDLPDDVDAKAVGQEEINQHDIRLGRLEHAHRLIHPVAHPDDCEAVGLEQCHQSSPVDRVIFNDNYPNLPHIYCYTGGTWGAKPRPQNLYARRSTVTATSTNGWGMGACGL